MYDIVPFGAGFTGRLCAHFIAQNYHSNYKWCLGGRSLSRMALTGTCMATRGIGLHHARRKSQSHRGPRISLDAAT
jgi:hypothetical protein